MAGAGAARGAAHRIAGADRLRLSVAIERWPVAGAFTIARGAKRHVDVVAATLDDGAGHVGRGEATPIYYHGETAETVRDQLLGVGIDGLASPLSARRSVPAASSPSAAWQGGRSGQAGDERPVENRPLTTPSRLRVSTRSTLRSKRTEFGLDGLLPRGAARNAMDAALWDLAGRQAGRRVWDLAGLDAPQPLVTAFTISLGEPARMEADARAAAGRYPLLKLKLAGDGDLDRVAAVRAGAPDARLIVDANEAWTGRDVAAEAAALLPFGVELIEQPVAAGQDHLLDGVASPIPLCADESCQDRADLPRCLGRYQAINIKLDKAGGLTEALALADAARGHGLDLMVGCMLSTSLGVAPAFLAAQGARWVDLDGPLLLAEDRDPAIRFDGGTMHAPPPELWG